jgi:hypothetical protein
LRAHLLKEKIVCLTVVLVIGNVRQALIDRVQYPAKRRNEQMATNIPTSLPTKVALRQWRTSISIPNRGGILAVCLLALTLSACGGVHSTLITKPENAGMFKEVTIVTPEVTSDKQDADTIALNEELKKIATQELQSLLASRNIAVLDNGEATVECHVEVKYGNRALRYFVGFGAGAGRIVVKIELRDRSGVTHCATSSEADLSMGAFGGSMTEVARKAIQEGVKEFGRQM